MTKEALKLALEAAYLAGFKASGEGYNGEYPFDDHNHNPEDDSVWVKNRDNALRETLAQPQDSETVAQTFTGLPKRKLRELLSAGWQINGVCFQRTEEDGTVRRGAATVGGMVLWWNQKQPAQPQQEPVAYRSRLESGSYTYCNTAQFFDNAEPLYTSPPAHRTWVGLTDCEREKLRSEADEADAGYRKLIKATEAKLKEKNT